MSIAYIKGDKQYETQVTFYIGGKRQDVIDKIVTNIMRDYDYDKDFFDYEKFSI